MMRPMAHNVSMHHVYPAVLMAGQRRALCFPSNARAVERTRLETPDSAQPLHLHTSARRGAACYAPLGDLSCSVSPALEKPVINLVVSVHLPWCLPMPMALKKREGVLHVTLIKSLGNLISLVDIHNLVGLAMEHPYGRSGQRASAIRYELYVRRLPADRGNCCKCCGMLHRQVPGS